MTFSATVLLLTLVLPGLVLANFLFIELSRFLPQYGTWLLYLSVGSLASAAIALLISVPLSLCGALFLTELAGTKVQYGLRPLLGISAQFPSILFGWLGAVLLYPPINQCAGNISGFLTTACALTLMLIPSLTLGFTKSVKTVPSSVRQAAFALGAGPITTAFHVVLPSARRPIIRRTIQSGARATGEGLIILVVVHSMIDAPQNDTLAFWILTSPLAWDVALAFLLFSACFAALEGLLQGREGTL